MEANPSGAAGAGGGASSAASATSQSGTTPPSPRRSSAGSSVHDSTVPLPALGSRVCVRLTKGEPMGTVQYVGAYRHDQALRYRCIGVD